ncbi:MAG: dihydroorotate dehydrogenase electron transfer subunit [Firmicutes bacterium]|nr:dihydroorotate dehydrogenase electron transfer subunit [Bacillota bacterium]
MSYKFYKIEEINHLNEEVFTLRFSGKFDGVPGQFYMIKLNKNTDPLLARPISISDIGDDYIVFLIQIMGRGTKEMSNLRVGDSLGLLGPLGTGFNIDSSKKVALLAGTAGIAPMLYLSKSLPHKPDLYVGYRSGEYYTEEFKSSINEMYIATEDGSVGHKGYALDILDASKYDKIYVCGPMPMIRATVSKFPNANIEVSLEAHMGCGIGACLSCDCKTRSGAIRICMEGPVIDAKELKL